MNDRLKAVANYALNRAGEASTWQGVGFIVTLAGVHFGAKLDWGAAAAAGGMLSGVIKAAFPDELK